eukprot:scaffold116357_cov36-Phaeocystis_antarctica.AAC.1
MGSRQDVAIDVAPQTTWHCAPNTRAESARCVLCARACCPPRAASPCPFVSPCQPTTRGPPAVVRLQG